MGKKNYKVGEAIKVVFQGKGVVSGLTVQMDVYDEADVLDAGQSTTMTEIGTTGRYKATFTPGAEGDWSVQIDDGTGGKVVKHFSVGSYNIQSIGANLQSVETKVDGLDLSQPPMIG